MGMTYVDEYETRKAVSEKVIGEVTYRWEYVAVSPIDGKVKEVNATIYKIEGDNKTRLGYGSYNNGPTSVRFDGANVVAVDVQAILSAQFYMDLQQLIS